MKAKLQVPSFKPVEFDEFRKQAAFECLANLESMNAHFIEQGMAQSERLMKLNELAIRQMRVLVEKSLSSPGEGD